MHITNDTLVNTAALTTAMHITDTLLDAWGQGCVELYQAIGEWAVIITEEEKHLTEALNETGECWPGVFAYEVTEDVGAGIRNAILLNNAPSADVVRKAVRTSVIRFCDYRGTTATVESYKRRSIPALR